MNGWQLVIVAVITGAASIISPVILSLITIRARRKDRQEDWERQDMVAKKVAEAARLLASNTVVTNNKLDVIHKLVNSNMTAAMQDSLDSATRERAALIELRQSRLDLGKIPSEDTAIAIKLADEKIAELTIVLAERKAQT